MTERTKIFEQMLESDPNNEFVLFGLANEYFKIGDHKKAIATFERYLFFETDEGAAYGLLAQSYAATNQRDLAKAAYEKGIKIALENGHPSMAEDFRQTLEYDYENE